MRVFCPKLPENSETIYSDEDKGKVRNNIEEIGDAEDSAVVSKSVVSNILRDCREREYSDACRNAQKKDEQKANPFCHFLVLLPAFIWKKWYQRLLQVSMSDGHPVYEVPNSPSKKANHRVRREFLCDLKKLRQRTKYISFTKSAQGINRILMFCLLKLTTSLCALWFGGGFWKYLPVGNV